MLQVNSEKPKADLTLAITGKNAYDSALSILRDFRGLRGLDRARIHDLLKVPGLGSAKVAQITAAFELGKRVCAGKLAEIYEYCKRDVDTARQVYRRLTFTKGPDSP